MRNIEPMLTTWTAVDQTFGVQRKSCVRYVALRQHTADSRYRQTYDRIRVCSSSRYSYQLSLTPPTLCVGGVRDNTKSGAVLSCQGLVVQDAFAVGLEFPFSERRTAVDQTFRVRRKRYIRPVGLRRPAAASRYRQTYDRICVSALLSIGSG